MRYDVHTHAFHPKVATRVVEQLARHYDVTPVGDGTLDDLSARVAAAGLDRFVVHTAATDPAQVIPANNWAIEIQRTRDNAFATSVTVTTTPDRFSAIPTSICQPADGVLQCKPSARTSS